MKFDTSKITAIVIEGQQWSVRAGSVDLKPEIDNVEAKNSIAARLVGGSYILVAHSSLDALIFSDKEEVH